MKRNSPFLVFPWQNDFLSGLKKHIDRATGGRPGRSLIIAPNQRPWRYLSQIYAKEKKAGALPKTLAFQDVAAIWSASKAPARQANTLDRIYLLRETVKELGKTDSALSRQFAAMSMTRFLPWGTRLASLLEEIFAQGKEARDIEHTGGEVDDKAEALLGSLKRIGEIYRQKLESASPPLTTPGLESLVACENSGNIPEYIRPKPDRPVFIAGFSALNGAQNRLFDALWRAGATVCLHGDPGLAEGSPLHSAARSQKTWIDRWGARTELAETPRACKTEYFFYSAYDDHSQIKKMAADLKQCDAENPVASTAIILPDAGLLMPVLHELPEREANISMGYPLSRSQLRGLINDIFRLRLDRAPDGKYYWRDLLRLLHQPFLDILAVDPEGETTLRPWLGALERVVRSGGRKYVDLAKAAAESLESTRKRLRKTEENLTDKNLARGEELLAKALAVLIDGPANAKTTRDLADAFTGICNFLIEHGGLRWKYFPLDAEALSRFQNRVIPVLADNLLGGEEFPVQILFEFTGALLDQERIPFEADPIVGAQIIGLLETRLLNFDQLFILDASDNVLPGPADKDPLLPNALRHAVGLPNNRDREEVVEYNLYRLLAGAQKAFFYWAEGAPLSDLSADKKYKSRYVERLIWEEEKRLGKLLAPGEGPLGVARASARLNKKTGADIQRNSGLNNACQKLLSGKLSATMLNEYLKCPAKFAMNRLMKLQAPDEVNERDDPPLVGACIHDALASLLAPYRNSQIRLADIPANELENALQKQFAEKEMTVKLPVDSYIMLEEAGRARLLKYLASQRGSTIIRKLEEKVDVKLELGGRDYSFTGKFDRIDERNGLAIILDYKTGKINAPEEQFWQDGEFFAALDKYCDKHAQFDDDGDKLLRQLAKRIPDIQLPLYMLMLNAESGQAPGNAAYVDLADKGKEIPLFAGAAEDGEIEKFITASASAARFILNHIEKSSRFPCFDAVCDYCEFKGACGS